VTARGEAAAAAGAGEPGGSGAAAREPRRPAAGAPLLKRRPRLVASDLDGTLLPPDLVVDPALVAAIGELQAAGVAFVLCTGRMVGSAAAMGERLGIARGFLVSYSGGAIVDLSSGDWLVHLPLESAAARDVVRHARRLGRHLNVFIDDRLYVEQDDDWTEWTTSYLNIDVRVVDDLLALVSERRPTKIVLAADPEDVAGLLPDLRARWAGTLNVSRSQPHFIELNDRRASKSGALEWLGRRLGHDGPTVACGDGLNDLDMLRWADLGVAVAEGDEEVHAAADVVVPRAELPGLFRRLAALPA